MINPLLFLLLCFFYLSLYGQKERTIKGIEGCKLLDSRTTLDEARKLAIQQAKVNAFQKAGFSESLSRTSLLTREIYEGEESEGFYESTSSMQSGEIKYFKLLEVEKKLDKNNQILLCVKADITVVQYESANNSIDLSLMGVEDNYVVGESLSFKLITNRDGYLWLFIIDEDNQYNLLFPSAYDNSNFIQKDDTLNLPSSNLVEWVTFSSKPTEKNSIIVVFTESEIFKKPQIESNFNKWSEWYHHLDQSKTKKTIQSFQIFSR